MEDIFEIRWHGRGGQGVVTAAKILALAAVMEGKYGVAQPFFGAERRGAPVMAFNRISNKKIRIKSRVYNPDLVAVVDKTLFGIVNVLQGLKEGGTVVINTPDTENLEFSGYTIWYLDATGIALDLGLKVAGIPLVNMPMLGAVSRASGIVSLDSVKEAVKDQIRQMIDKNIEAVERGWENVKIYRGEKDG